MSYKQEPLTFREHPVFCGVCHAHLFFFLCCPVVFWVPCCGVHYDFRIKSMFCFSLPSFVCRRAHVLCVCLPVVMSNRYLFLFCFPSSCVPNVASFSGLIDCSFSIHQRLFTNMCKLDIDLKSFENRLLWNHSQTKATIARMVLAWSLKKCVMEPTLHSRWLLFLSLYGNF